LSSIAKRTESPPAASGVFAAVRGAKALLVIALLGAIYLGYSPALDGELQFDDLRTIVDNTSVKDLEHSAALRPGDLLAGTGRALTDLTFALNYRFSGPAVRPFHLFNLLLHLATVLAILALTLDLLRRVRWPWPFATAWLAAALFGLHPLQTQAVAYLSQRAEVLAALLYLVGLRCAVAAEERKGVAVSLLAYAGAIFCVLLGWGAKPTLATFPAALLLLGAAVLRPTVPVRVRALWSLPFWGVTLLFSARLIAGVKGGAHAGFAIPTLSARTYLLTQSRVLLTYVRLLFWPAGQNLDWTFPVSTSLFEPRTLICVIAILATLGAAARLWTWSARDEGDPEIRLLARLLSFGIAWFFLLLAPTSSVVPVADVIEEHRVYLASWGLFLPVAAALVLASRRLLPGRRAAAALAAGSLLICAVLTAALFRRAAVWATSIDLWSDVVAKSPQRVRGHMNLAGALLASGRYEEAIAQLREVRALGEESAELGANLAFAYLESGRLPEAERVAAETALRWPHYAPARHTLGQIASIQGDYRAARDHFAAALALDPGSVMSLTSLAVVQERLGDRAGACASWARYARTGGRRTAESARERQAALGCHE
jgi:tetratricopeptide (TPR) repeat protein